MAEKMDIVKEKTALGMNGCADVIRFCNSNDRKERRIKPKEKSNPA